MTTRTKIKRIKLWHTLNQYLVRCSPGSEPQYQDYYCLDIIHYKNWYIGIYQYEPASRPLYSDCFIFESRDTRECIGNFDTLVNAKMWIDLKDLLEQPSTEHHIEIDI